MNLTLSEIAGLVGGELRGRDASATGAATDNRELREGDLFVAIRGEQVDGHRFVPDALARGASGSLVSDASSPQPSILVGDTGRALLELARAVRGDMEAKVVGITGSTGKTSVKDLTASVLSQRFEVAASPRSFNTEVGVPLTILNAPAEAEALVLEMGSRGSGHISKLCEMARPVVGLVTSVGLAHTEMFGSLENVANAKAELIEALDEGGIAVLNADDSVVRGFAARTRARALLFGIGSDAEIGAEDVALDDLGRASFTLRTPAGSERVELPVLGEHMVSNALAASAVGIALGLSAGECAAGLKDAQLSPWRMELVEGSGGIRILNDAYNANPTSMAAALKAARWMSKGARTIAVLGEMAELGEVSAHEHERVGELVARLGIEHLVVVGEAAAAIAIGAEREGVEPERIVRAGTVDEAIQRVRDLAREGDVVLLKASRVAGLERAAEALA